MSTLKQTLRSDLTAAMKSRDELRSATLRMALTALTNEEVAGRQQRELSDDDVLAVLRREAKKRRESAAAYDGAGRDDLAARERAELAVLETYLPAQLTDEQLSSIVSTAIAELGAEGPRAMGTVMRIVSPRVNGRADGGRVAGEVRRQLGM